MRTLNAVGALCLAGVLVAGAQSPAMSAPITRPSAAAAPLAMHAGFRGPGWYAGRQPWGRVVAPYGWDDAYDDACSGNHPPWASEYAGYPDFWCSPGFGRYNRHWPR